MNFIKKFRLFKESNINNNIDNSFNHIIDYTSLTGNESKKDIEDLCQKAKKLNVKSVCIYPKWVSLCKKLLSDSDVLICTVIGFPTGENSLDSKLSECDKAIQDGADEIDMVCNWKLLDTNIIFGEEDNLSGNNKKVYEEIKQLTQLSHENNVILKVIVESSELSDEEIELVTNLCIKAGADFIKTSTGKVGNGADINDVNIMFNIINDLNSNMKIKASGGIRTIEDIEKFAPFVDRFGMGFGSVDKINGISDISDSDSEY